MNNMTTQNHWLNKSNANDDLKKLDDIMMEAWSNDATVEELLANLPDETKAFFMKMKIGCPDLLSDGFKIIFEINQ